MSSTLGHTVVEIDLYEDLTHFHHLSPDERLAIMQAMIAPPPPARIEPSWDVPPIKSVAEMMFEAPSELSFAPHQEVVGELTTLVDDLSSYEFTISEAPQSAEPKSAEPSAELTIPEPPVSFQTIAPVKAVVKEVKVLPPAKPPRPTAPPTPVTETVSKTGVRISVRQVETHGSMTLNVDDILGDDDWDVNVKSASQSAAEPPVREPERPVARVQESAPSPVATKTENVIKPKLEPPTPPPLRQQAPVNQTANSALSAEPPVAAKAPPPAEATKQTMTKPPDPDTNRDSKPLRVTGFLAEYLSGELKENANAIACPACGHESDEQDLICIQCGGFLDATEAPANAQAVCEDCGEAVEADEVFCPECGAILRVD